MAKIIGHELVLTDNELESLKYLEDKNYVAGFLMGRLTPIYEDKDEGNNTPPYYTLKLIRQ